MSNNIYKLFYEDVPVETIKNIEDFIEEYDEVPSDKDVWEYIVDTGLGNSHNIPHFGSAYVNVLTYALSKAVNNYVQNAEAISDIIESKIDNILETGGEAFDISQKIELLINYYGNRDNFISELVQNLDFKNSLENIEEISVSCDDNAISSMFFVNGQKVTDSDDIKNEIDDILMKSAEFYNVLKTGIDELMEENELTFKKQKSPQP